MCQYLDTKDNKTNQSAPAVLFFYFQIWLYLQHLHLIEWKSLPALTRWFSIRCGQGLREISILHLNSTYYVNNSLFFCLHHRFSKATPTQQMLPRRCCPNPRWRASSGSVPLPGKQASHCASRCMDVRYQVGIAEIPADLHAYSTHTHISALPPKTHNSILYWLYSN